MLVTRATSARAPRTLRDEGFMIVGCIRISDGSGPGGASRAQRGHACLRAGAATVGDCS